MEQIISYEVSPAMQDASIRQYFFSVLFGWRRVIPLTLLTLLAIALIASGAASVPAAIVGSVVVVLLILWVKAYFQSLSQGRAGLRLMEHHRIEVRLNEEAVEYRSSTGTRVHRWEKIDRLIETKDFLILMHGKFPILSLPKEFLSPTAAGLIRSKLP